MNDPMEAMIRSALKRAGHDALEGDDNQAHLDFFVPGVDVYIEVKQFHSDRVADQMSRVENVIVAQGRGAVRWLAELIGSNATAPQGGEAQTAQPTERVQPRSVTSEISAGQEPARGASRLGSDAEQISDILAQLRETSDENRIRADTLERLLASAHNIHQRADRGGIEK